MKSIRHQAAHYIERRAMVHFIALVKDEKCLSLREYAGEGIQLV